MYNALYNALLTIFTAKQHIFQLRHLSLLLSLIKLNENYDQAWYSTSFHISKTAFNLEDSYFIWYLNLSSLPFFQNKFQAKKSDCSKIIIEDPLKSIMIFFSTENDSKHPLRSRSVIRSDDEFIFNFVEIILEYEKKKKKSSLSCLLHDYSSWLSNDFLITL